MPLLRFYGLRLVHLLLGYIILLLAHLKIKGVALHVLTCFTYIHTYIHAHNLSRHQIKKLTVHTSQTYSAHITNLQCTHHKLTVHTSQTYSAHITNLQCTHHRLTVHTSQSYSAHISARTHTPDSHRVRGCEWRTHHAQAFCLVREPPLALWSAEDNGSNPRIPVHMSCIYMMYAHVCVYIIYIYVCIFCTYTHVQIYIQIFLCVYIYIYMYIIYIYIYIYIHIYTHTHIYIYMQAYR